MKTGKYPLATVIGYGPNYMTATKLVVSIFKKPGQREPVAMEKWIVQGGDIRKDPTILDAVTGFMKRHHVAETVTYDRVFGCPHEEEIGYPIGQVCPHCPFWANLDRHTLEPKSLDQPLTPQQILAGLSIKHDTQPLKSFAAVERHREQMVEPFLQVVESALRNPQGTTQDEAALFSYTLAFLVKWREPRALPLVIRWLSLPGESAFDLGLDTVTQWGSRMLATACGGDLAPIKQLILNREANEYCRGQAVEALAVLAAWNERSQEEVVDYFGWLAREGLEREPNHVWDCLAAACADIEATAVFHDLRQAGEHGLINPGFISLEELNEVEVAPRGTEIARFREGQEPFDDLAKETSWWACFSRHRERVPSVPDSASDIGQPYVAPPKIRRNEPCPCGSGKKYTKCCGA